VGVEEADGVDEVDLGVVDVWWMLMDISKTRFLSHKNE